MPLFQHGSLDDLTQTGLDLPAVLDEAKAEPPFLVSADRRGIALKSLRLQRESSIFVDLFNPAFNIYFIAWTWDFSGNPVTQYPPAQLNVNPDSLVLRLHNSEERLFVGAGVVLFPPQKVTAGINVCVHLWKSNQDTRGLGNTLSSVARAIQESKLNQLLSTIAIATATPAAIVALATNASLELTSAIGAVLKTSTDEHLDLFQGTYDVTKPWSTRDEPYEGHGTQIVLSLLS